MIVLCAVASMHVACDAHDDQSPLSRVNVEEVAQVTLGNNGTGMGEAEFQKPLDATFWGDTIAVLDAAAPWIRLFASDGTFLRGFGGKGEGPGEAEWPWGLSLLGDTLITLLHSRGWDQFTASGTVVGTIRPADRVTGLIELCEYGTVGFVVPPGTRNPAFLARMGMDGAVLDTVAVVGSTRGLSRNHHAFMAASSPNNAMIYNEGNGPEGALLEIDCRGQIVGSHTLPDSLGQGESMRPVSDGRFAVAPPELPVPAGLAVVGSHTYWATRYVLEGDSVTVITRLGAVDGQQKRELDGWYTLLDGSPDGRLLFSNAWTRMLNWADGDLWGLEPKVFLVDVADIF